MGSSLVPRSRWGSGVGAVVVWAVGCSDRRGLEACPPGVRRLFFLFAAGPLLASPLPVLDRLLVLVALFEFEVIVF
jgi:hypothetical protein